MRSNLRTSPHLSHRSAIYHILMISHSGRTLLVNLPCKSSQNFMFCKLLYKKLCIINHETDAWCAKNEILTGSVWNICIHCVSCKSVFRTYHYDQGRPSSQCHRAMALVVFLPHLEAMQWKFASKSWYPKIYQKFFCSKMTLLCPFIALIGKLHHISKKELLKKSIESSQQKP